MRTLEVSHDFMRLTRLFFLCALGFVGTLTDGNGLQSTSWMFTTSHCQHTVKAGGRDTFSNDTWCCTVISVHAMLTHSTLHPLSSSNYNYVAGKGKNHVGNISKGPEGKIIRGLRKESEHIPLGSTGINTAGELGEQSLEMGASLLQSGPNLTMTHLKVQIPFLFHSWVWDWGREKQPRLKVEELGNVLQF